MPNYNIVLGGAEHEGFFVRNSDYTGEDWFWTVPKDAQIGDICFVYLTAPLSRIVGRFTITGEPFLNLGMFPDYSGKYMAEIGNVQYYPPKPELTIRGLRALFCDWAWLRYPRNKTRIPPHILPPFLELLEM